MITIEFPRRVEWQFGGCVFARSANVFLHKESPMVRCHMFKYLLSKLNPCEASEANVPRTKLPGRVDFRGVVFCVLQAHIKDRVCVRSKDRAKW